MIRRSSLNSAKTASTIVDNDLALRHRIETLAALASSLLVEVERLRDELSPTSQYPLNDKSSVGSRRSSARDDSIDFYREIELYEIELIKRALRRVRGSQRRAAALLGLNPTTLNAKIKHFGTSGFDLSLFLQNRNARPVD